MAREAEFTERRCEVCNKPRQPRDRFCGQCGARFPSGPAEGDRQAERAESLLAWERLMQRKTWRGLAFAVAGVLVALVAFLLPVGDLRVWLVLGGPIAGVVLMHIASSVSSTDYYELPHSRGADGEHRCVFCGGRGIHRRGEYRSATVHSHCSRCERLLFTALGG